MNSFSTITHFKSIISNQSSAMFTTCFSGTNESHEQKWKKKSMISMTSTNPSTKFLVAHNKYEAHAPHFRYMYEIKKGNNISESVCDWIRMHRRHHYPSQKALLWKIDFIPFLFKLYVMQTRVQIKSFRVQIAFRTIWARVSLVNFLTNL